MACWEGAGVGFGSVCWERGGVSVVTFGGVVEGWKGRAGAHSK